MEKVKVSSILLSEDSIKDQNGKNIIIGPLPDIAFKVVPNNLSFNINFSLLNIKSNTPYNLEVLMVQHDGKIIIESHIEGLTIESPNGEESGNSFVNLGVRNQEFTSFGNSEVIISIEDQITPENNDQMTIVVPILKRG